MSLTIVRASTTSAGAQVSSASSAPALSADGTKVVFSSTATNLVAGDVNGQADIFVKTLSTGAISLVSTSSAEVQQNFGTNSPLLAFTPDGTRVVFTSRATNLTAQGDTNSVDDIFIKTLSTGAISRVSETAAGANASDVSAIRAGGVANNFVAFESSATNLVAGDNNLSKDIFVKDLTTGAVVLASVTAAGDIGDNSSTQASISADGTKVAFVSFASNLGAGGSGDVFLKNMTTGDVTVVNTAADGTAANGGSNEAMISADGTKVVFASTASNLVAGDTNGLTDIFVKTLATGAIQRISVSNLGVQADGSSINASFSPDGTKVGFRSSATNLVTGDTNGQLDVFVYDLTAGTLTRIVNADGVEPQGGGAFAPAMGPGGAVAFGSTATNLVTGDTNGVQDVFVAAPAAVPVVAEPEPEPEPPRPVSTGGNDSGVLPPGNNVFLAGIGADSITGADGSDSIQGNQGADSLAGGGGTDSLFGGRDNDSVAGGDGADSLSGDLGNDSVSGGTGTDSVFGGDGTDSLAGGEGADSLSGNQGADSISGDGGNDTLYAGQGADTVHGGDGDDKLSGDLGNDVMRGGAGADTFVFAKGGGLDWVEDFHFAEGDRIQLAPGTTYMVVDFQGFAMIVLGNGDQIGLVGDPFTAFSPSWVTFA